MTHAFVNVASHLPEIASALPDTLAVAVQGPRQSSGEYAYARMTAAELEAESNRVARGLQVVGIVREMRTVLMVTPSIDFFVLTFALFKIGAVPVMVDPGMGVKNLKECLAEAEPEAFIGIPKAHIARVLFGWARGTNRINVTAGRRLFWGGHTLASVRDADASPIMAETAADETAAILFTSGSTGIPKGAVYTHGNFDAQVAALRDDYGIEPGERDLATFPLFALFGPALGMAAIVPSMDASKPITADPRNIVAAIEEFEATNLFASPALIEIVGRYAVEHSITLPSLKRVISAGAPADPESLARFTALLRGDAPLLPSYGATEALPVANIDARELLEDTAAQTEAGAGICVGRAISGIEIRIVRISDDVIAMWDSDLELSQGEIGEICVKGPVVTQTYFARERSTELSKIPDPSDKKSWHRMGDIGYLDDSGRLWFCGRKSHRVVTDAGETMFTIPCERIFNTHANVRRSALVGVQSHGACVPLLCVELKDGVAETEQLIAELLEIGSNHARTKSIRRILVHPGFPMDVRHNAKIFREKLARWAEERQS